TPDPSPPLASARGGRGAERLAPEERGRTDMIRRIAAALALVGALALPGQAAAEATALRVARQFGVAYLQFMVMQDQKLIEKHAKAAGLGDIATDWPTFR